MTHAPAVAVRNTSGAAVGEDGVQLTEGQPKADNIAVSMSLETEQDSNGYENRVRTEIPALERK